jgi:NADH-quinone oxidoreductase subunit G/NADP-reducing hydrogenase subunit HndD
MDQNKIKITVDGKEILTEAGQTILGALSRAGISVPTLCYHSDLETKASCRICVVEIKGKKDLVASCAAKIENGLEIMTESPRVRRARKINLELLFAQHKEECRDCIFLSNCQLLKLAKEYKAEICRFRDRKTKFPVYSFGPALLFDSSKCIDCRNCVEVCQKQEVNFFDIKGKGYFLKIVPTKDKSRDCIYCGQCLVHCPVGAFEAVGEFEDVEKCLNQKDKTVVFQFAPAVRTSIGEEFGLAQGEVVTEKLVGAIKKLGVYKVFDTSVGADFTTIEEAGEFIEKLNSNRGPCLSSCCPAWVKYIEFNYPEFIPNIATTRSPQVILGGLIKTYWAEKEKIDPKKLIVVSVMPCVAKKYEIQRKELKINGQKPVDYVLTTRELAYLFAKRKIDLKNVQPQKVDNPLGEASGAGVIYGASGGVAESVLRVLCAKLTGVGLPKVDFKAVRGQQGVKKAVVDINGRQIKIVVASGINNAKKILEDLKKNPAIYDAVEIMACPGGCVGGGGQPVPADVLTRKARAEALYEIDQYKKVRFPNENPVVQEIYREFLNSPEIIHKICHTKYFKKKREVNLNL